MRQPDQSEIYRLEIVAGGVTRVAEVAIGPRGLSEPCSVRWRHATEEIGSVVRDATGYSWHTADGHRAGSALTLAVAVRRVMEGAW